MNTKQLAAMAGFMDAVTAAADDLGIELYPDQELACSVAGEYVRIRVVNDATDDKPLEWAWHLETTG